MFETSRLIVVAAVLDLVLLRAAKRARSALDAWIRAPTVKLETSQAAPFVTVVVPARNEAHAIERCVRSLLNQDYPPAKLRVIVIDDNSTDATHAIVARMAHSDARLRCMRGLPLAQGWLGKSWALHQVTASSADLGEWILFTDADTVHEPLALASAVIFATDHDLDILSFGTRQLLETWAERMLVPVIVGLAMTVNGTFTEINDPTRRHVAKANGQFILTRTAAYRAIGGHASVRSEIVEDFAFARRAKRLGHRVMLVDGRHLVATRGYRSVGEIWRGFSKNALNETVHIRGGLCLALVGLPLLGLGPYLLAPIALRRLSRFRRVADAVLLFLAGVHLYGLLDAGRRCASAAGTPARFGLAQPLAVLFVWAILVNALARRLRGRGTTWKGRAVEL